MEQVIPQALLWCQARKGGKITGTQDKINRLQPLKFQIKMILILHSKRNRTIPIWCIICYKGSNLITSKTKIKTHKKIWTTSNGRKKCSKVFHTIKGIKTTLREWCSRWWMPKGWNQMMVQGCGRPRRFNLQMIIKTPITSRTSTRSTWTWCNSWEELLAILWITYLSSNN